MVWVFVISWRTVGAAESVFIGSALWEGEVSYYHHSRRRTHIKDPKNILEVRPPDHDRLFIFLSLETSRDCIPVDPLGELPLNICYDPAIKHNITDCRDACRWFNSHRQLTDRTVHGLAELVRFLSIRPSVKHSADVGTEQPKFDVVRFIHH